MLSRSTHEINSKQLWRFTDVATTPFFKHLKLLRFLQSFGGRSALMMAREFGSKEYLDKGEGSKICCFICGATEDEAELLAGASGAICAKCAKDAYKHFSVRNEEECGTSSSENMGRYR